MNKVCRFRYKIRVLVFTVLATTGISLTANAKPAWTKMPLARDYDEKAAPCDWLEFHAIPRDGGLLIAYRCTSPVNFSLGAAYSIYLDTDAKRETGYRGSGDQFPIGADYLLQGATLYRYAGHYADNSGTDWAWEPIGLVTYTVDGDWADFTLTSEQVSLTGDKVEVILVGDNVAAEVGGNYNDDFPDNALEGSGKGKSITIRLKQSQPATLH